MNKNLEEFIRKDIDILLEDSMLTSLLASSLIDYIMWKEECVGLDYPWSPSVAFEFFREAMWRAEKIVKENEEVGLYDR